MQLIHDAWSEKVKLRAVTFSFITEYKHSQHYESSLQSGTLINCFNLKHRQR